MITLRARDGAIYDSDTGLVVIHGITHIPADLFDEAKTKGWKFHETTDRGLRVSRPVPPAPVKTTGKPVKDEKTSKRVASIASKIMKGEKYTDDEVKTLAASALTQTG